MNFIRSLFIAKRFYIFSAIIITFFLIGFAYPFGVALGRLGLFLLILLVVVDILLLFNRGSIYGDRQKVGRFSNGDANPVIFHIENNYSFKVRVSIIDEIPHQFQVRDFLMDLRLKPNEEKTLQYELKPVKRGEYFFGNLNVYVESPLRLLSRRFRLAEEEMVPTYPSFLQMRKYELLAISNRLTEAGVKKIRRVGNNKEFDQIREYVIGDDQRTMNWKATARNNQLMVNQYQEEKSQQVYSLIDKGRVMKMPFDHMTLLDYAINASLVISNIAIRKQDKAGIITFSKRVDKVLKASRQNSQMQKVLEMLYREKTGFQETDYAKLVVQLKRNVPQRSLLILYTNFESLPSLERQLPYLKIIAKSHLLLVVFFENSELDDLLESEPQSTEEIYLKTIGEKFVHDKRQIVQELKRQGIQSILTRPENLTVDTLNKYLEIKARGML